ncbi:TnsA-like heteromeric transposase endonuclease subunit [uncultured Brachybacterium sp.]|uniref:TnsA-like heteromeric transposase endonuclease subunit n=1 Tax=uncultured Brachybacterium sp. TaxID=189680 RepID=UPI00262AEBAB|nr:TnsA-like heteromeric transposase endonuclease subunit [uncultured Brachybacterium sp.]
MGGREVFLRYCTVAGDEVATTWEEARADLIVEGLPVRVPPTYRGQRSYPGLFWTATNDQTLVYESLLELDRLWLADFNPAVTSICTQPFQVTGRDGGGLRKHVPDLLLINDDGTPTVVDVKPAAFLEKPRVRAQFEWTRRLCREKGWRYEVFTGGDPIVLRNIKLLAVGRRPRRVPDECLTEARARLDGAETTLGKVLARWPVTCDESMWRVAVFALVWSGEVAIDLHRPANAETILRRTAGVMV